MKNSNDTREDETTQIASLPQSTTDQGKTGSEQRKKVVVQKKLAGKAIKLEKKIIFTLLPWLHFLIKFPEGKNFVSILGDKIQCIKKYCYTPGYWSNDHHNTRYYLAVDEEYLCVRKPFFTNGFLAHFLTSEICTIDWMKNSDVLVVCFEALKAAYQSGDHDNYDTVKKTALVDYVSFLIYNIDLSFFVANPEEMDKVPNHQPPPEINELIEKLLSENYFGNATNSTIDFMGEIIFEQLPLEYSERDTLRELLDTMRPRSASQQSETDIPMDDIMNLLILQKAYGGDDDGMAFLVPKTNSAVFPWTPLDDEGFPVNARYHWFSDCE